MLPILDIRTGGSVYQLLEINMKKLGSIYYTLTIMLILSITASISSFYFSSKYNEIACKLDISNYSEKINKIDDIDRLRNIAISNTSFTIEDTLDHSETYKRIAYLTLIFSAFIITIFILLAKYKISNKAVKRD